MGKMQNALILTLILEISMWIFYNNVPSTEIFNLIQNPSLWTTSAIYTMLTDNLFGAVAATALIVGLYYIRTDFIFYVIISGIFITFISVIVNFHGWIYSQQWFGNANELIALLVTAPLLIYYIITILDFARGKD